ncbi:hypothetical protein FB451DRAFT_1281605 [Mycena latifolia]|nr:hypothetical protein FB451DRAFT_1281605 [Mycena latifolia]
MPHAASSSSKKARSPEKPKSPTKGKPISPGLGKRRKEWKESLPIAPWTLQFAFKHADGTTIVNKTDAKEDFPLNDYEITRLPCELEPRPPSIAIRWYCYDQLVDLATRKCTKLGMHLQVPAREKYRLRRVSRTGGVSASIPALQLPECLEHFFRPNPPPLKIPDYTCPPQAQTADPPKITWKPSRIMRPVTVDDACRLYCITAHDIRDLSAHSPWIDLSTVAKRALTLHGGFHAHKKLVRRSRDEEEKRLEKAKKTQSDFTFSRIISLQMQWDVQTSDQDMLYDWTGRADQMGESVAVLYPISSESQNDYGTDWEWMPFWGEF